MRYVALLRGVNVGGKNIISKDELRMCFVDAGLKNVRTYINSGNVIFDSDGDTDEIVGEASEMMKTRHDISTSMAIISAEALKEAVESAPKWWGAGADIKHNAIFVIAPAKAWEIAAAVGSTEYEKVYIYNEVIFWSAPLKTYSRTKWSKLSGTPAYKSITVRNANTARKLSEIVYL